MKEHRHDRQQDYRRNTNSQDSHCAHIEQFGQHRSDLFSIQEGKTNDRIPDSQQDNHIKEVKITRRGNRSHGDKEVWPLVFDDLFDSQNQEREPDHGIQKIRMPDSIQDSPITKAVGQSPCQNRPSVLPARLKTQF